MITKAEIEQFGRHKNFTVDFTGGVNVISGQNEVGKSTLCTFLYAMLYGLPNESKKLGIRDDLRKRYLPWDGGVMSGSLHFTADGRSYVLTRRFAKTRRGDKVSLKDAVTWEEITDIAPDDIGRTFLGVGAEGFLKTLFINQMGAAIVPDGDDEILKRLFNLGQSGAEDTSYQAAATALEKARHELLSKTEKAGILPRLEQEMAELERELLETNRLTEQFREDILLQGRLKQEGELLKDEAQSLAEKKELAKEYVRFAAAKQADGERTRFLERKQESAQRTEEQKKKLAELIEQAKKYQSVSKMTQTELFHLAQTEKEMEDIREEIAECARKKERLFELEMQLTEKKSSQRLGINILMLIIACVVAVLGIVCGFLISPVLYFLVPVGVLLGVISCVGRMGKKREKQELFELEKNIETLCAETAAEKVNALTQRLEKMQKELNSTLSAAGAKSVEEFTKLISEKLRLEQEWSAAEKELSLLQEADKQIEEDLQHLPQGLHEVFAPEVAAYTGPQVEELDRLLAANHAKQMENQRAHEAARHRVESAMVGIRSADVILSELAQKEEALSQYRFHYDALVAAQKAMEQSYLELKKDFAPVLNTRVGEILSVLTEGKYNELKVADDYKIMLREQEGGQVVSAEYLSGGTYDVLYFALRMGIAQVIFPEGIPLLVLDDSFLQLDDKRAALAAAFLEKQSAAEQVIYFTCHESQAELFGINSNRIMLK